MEPSSRDPRRVCIATSIAPRKIPQQRLAVESWTRLGFRVLSVNARTEIDTLAKEFPEVEFVDAPRTAEAVLGRPFVFVTDVLAALAQSGAETCGIVNSDIVLRAGSDFAGFVRESAAGALLFGSRVDVESLESPRGRFYREGYDLFFFDRGLIERFEPQRYCMGVPWWDYWFPLVSLRAGVPLRRLVSPVALHVIHPAAYSKELWVMYGALFVLQHYAEERERPRVSRARSNYGFLTKTCGRAAYDAIERYEACATAVRYAGPPAIELEPETLRDAIERRLRRVALW